MLLWGAVALLIVFWIWALFFASKESVNKIEDRAWAERAEAICVATDAQLRALEAQASPDIEVRADLVVERIQAKPPADAAMVIAIERIRFS